MKSQGQVYDEAELFLKLLDPEATRFTFQTFDEDRERKLPSLTKVIHGSLSDNFQLLCKLNDQGAGIFITINETNLRGRKATNIVRVRCLFADLDGSPKPKDFLKPTIEVETSEARWHLYYKVSNVELDEFTTKQKALIAKFGSDPSVHDLPRVMRLPGFFHRKKTPRLVKIVSSSDVVYTADQFSESPGTDHLKNYKSTGAGANFKPSDLPGRTDDELRAVLETSQIRKQGDSPGKWLVSMLSATASMIGRGWSDAAIKLACAPYCDGGADDPELGELIDSGRKKFNKPNGPESEPPDDTEDDLVLSTPIDLWNKFEPPALPKGLLPEVIERFAFEQGAMMGADPAGLALAAIAVCSAAVPDFIRIKVKRHDDWMESTRSWVGLVGDPSAKKTPMINRATRQITKIDATMRRAYQAEKKRWENLSKEEKKIASPPKQTFLKLDDVTIEAAQPVCQDSPNGVLCHRDELSGWFGSMDKYAGHKGANADRAFWLRAYDGHSYSWDRTSRGSGVIEHLSISVLGGIQPEAMRKLVEGSVDDGLIQRITPIMVRRGSVGNDEPESPAGVAYDNLVSRLAKMKRPFEEIISFDEEAREIRNELEKKHNDYFTCEAFHKKLASHVGKYDGIFARLCLLWHCIESGGDEPGGLISKRTAQRVADFLHTFLLPHALAFYTDIFGLPEDSERLAAVAGFILARKLEVLTNRDIQRGDRTMRKLDDRETEKVCQQLDALGWLNRVPGPRADSKPRWNVNPEVHKLFEERGRLEEERRTREREIITSMLSKKP